MTQGWFGPKRVGWGVRVLSWKAVALFLVFALAEALADRLPGLDGREIGAVRIALVVALVAVIVLTYRPARPPPG